ncbi:tyrosine-protein phosphatase [Paenibacillus hexagrammi]|uniref:protein-tyrosine-phosphatase n=1 Tax=Paenibacillus hexagrammi TaxID=2908839 RepID=A0ABY3SJV9_9BACL|nr:CpsB/CapC family capsule biosynthesis tyrosine phosphatase [Paenibacillus sp. YPD9-1]UJF34313.1 tyrosine-protein phosphatase [Paenibacillus sp. YPD9-1]
MLIDTHCHILPNIDDGAGSLEESIAMAKGAVLNDIGVIVATPHYGKGKYVNDAKSIELKVSQMNAALESVKVNLTVITGQEIHVRKSIVEELYTGKLTTINQSRFMILELPSYGIPTNFHDLLYELSILQIVPVIAHPERNFGFLKNKSSIRSFFDQGVLFQVTASSLLGAHGRKYRISQLNCVKVG